MYIDTTEVKQIALAAFPNYHGRSFQVKPFQGPMRLTSYWDGGSRDYYAVIDLATNRQAAIPENGTPFMTPGGVGITDLPVNHAVIRHSITCGKDAGLTIYVRAENLTRLLPAPVELTDDEKTVLKFTSSLKSSYGGISNYRFHSANRETGITLDRWESGKLACIGKGLLNKSGAITNEGRNAVNPRS